MVIRRFIYVFPIVLLAFALPEILAHWDYPVWITERSWANVGSFVILAAFCAACLGHRAGKVLVSVLWLAQLSQVMHHQFFQRFYSGPDVLLTLVEAGDMATAILGMWRISLPVISVSAVSLLLLLAVSRQANGVLMSRASLAIALVILLANGIHQANQSLWKAAPQFHQLAVHNALNSLTTWLTHFAFTKPEAIEHFHDYQVTARPHALQPNIILVIGESMNPDHMSVLGYEKRTTPGLQRLLETHPSFAKKIYSSGVTTRVSTPMLLTVNREPKNLSRYKTRTGHLVSQAKDGGYYTALYATQTLDFMSELSVMSDFDVFIDYSQKRGMEDHRFVSFLNDQSVPTKPAFTILNIRAPHMPYAEHVPEIPVFSATKTGDTIEDTRNEYDDAMLTADGIITASIETLLAKSPRPTLVILTADHGENMGENGRFGHNRLNLNTATVPFLMFAANWPVNQAVPEPNCVGNHYQLGVFMLEQLGFDLQNPNDVDGTTYYINGNDIYGNNGEFIYKLPACSSH